MDTETALLVGWIICSLAGYLTCGITAGACFRGWLDCSCSGWLAFYATLSAVAWNTANALASNLMK